MQDVENLVQCPLSLNESRLITCVKVPCLRIACILPCSSALLCVLCALSLHWKARLSFLALQLDAHIEGWNSKFGPGLHQCFMQYLFNAKYIHKLLLKVHTSPSPPPPTNTLKNWDQFPWLTEHFTFPHRGTSSAGEAEPTLPLVTHPLEGEQWWFESQTHLPFPQREQWTRSEFLSGFCRAFNILHPAAFWRKAAASTGLHADLNLGAQSDLACPQGRQGSVWGTLDEWGQGLSCTMPFQRAQKRSCCCKGKMMPETPFPSWWTMNKDLEGPIWKQLDWNLNTNCLPKNLQENYRSENFTCPSAVSYLLNET